jgi:glycosyltransferase involved in cell wall biosynthesis
VAIVAASLRILGGQSVQAALLLERFAADPEIDAWLVPINPVPPAPFDRLLGIKFIRTIVTQLAYWPLLWRELRGADVVHVFSASYASFLLSPLPAVIVARLLGKPIVLNYHSGEAPDHLSRSWIARYVLRHVVDLNVVPSPFLRDVFATFGLAAEVVANSVDVERFRYRNRTTFRPAFISTRNLEPMYNVASTLRAFARIQAVHPDASLTVVGAGSQSDELRALATRLQLQNVRFTGRVSPAEIAAHYDEADLYLQTPSIDNMPLSVLEAFACDLPVISTNVGGVPSMLTDGVHGLLAEEGDEAAIADHACRLLRDQEYARTLTSAARAACESYRWPVVRAGWLAAYRAALRATRHTKSVSAEVA